MAEATKAAPEAKQSGRGVRLSPEQKAIRDKGRHEDFLKRTPAVMNQLRKDFQRLGKFATTGTYVFTPDEIEKMGQVINEWYRETFALYQAVLSGKKAEDSGFTW